MKKKESKIPTQSMKETIWQALLAIMRSKLETNYDYMK